MLAWTRGTTVALIALTIFGIVACGSERSHPVPVGAPVPQVGSVVVAMSPDLTTDRRDRLNKLGATFMLKGALEAALSKAGKLDAQSPVALQVDITKFRMRSGATVFWLGAMAGGATKTQLEQISIFGHDIGLAFQIIDDILDATSTKEIMGKSVRADEKNEKATYPKILGLEKSRAEAKRLTDHALAALAPFGEAPVALREIATYMLARTN